MIFIDTETTGLLKPMASALNLQPSIIEIYAVKVDENFQFVEELETFIDPKVPLPENITKITGIEPRQLEGAPHFSEVYQRLARLFLGETHVVAHNCAFDMGMVRIELERIDRLLQFPWPMNWICTVEKSFHIKNRRLKLTDLHEFMTGKPHHDGAHRAKHDVFALIRSYMEMKKRNMV